MMGSLRNVYKLVLQRSTQKSILLNRGHVDWRTYKLAVEYVRESPHIHSLVCLDEVPYVVLKTGDMILI